MVTSCGDKRRRSRTFIGAAQQFLPRKSLVKRLVSFFYSRVCSSGFLRCNLPGLSSLFALPWTPGVGAVSPVTDARSSRQRRGDIVLWDSVNPTRLTISLRQSL
uniref:Uncharacterized protein n=1 Tax=Oryza brachyantha TaxID=4533 RepID=J3LQ60_ORYBR